MAHRMQAADFAGKQYYHQDPKLLRFVLSKPPDRVKYTNLSLVRKDFEEIEALGKEAGILEGTAHFDDYADPSFVPDETTIQPYDWEGRREPSSRRHCLIETRPGRSWRPPAELVLPCRGGDASFSWPGRRP